jgi:hypothetical protein
MSEIAGKYVLKCYGIGKISTQMWSDSVVALSKPWNPNSASLCFQT